MKSIQHRIRDRLIDDQTHPKNYFPFWLRSLVRATSGGNDWTAGFVRRILWQYRWLLLTATAANIGAALVEALTLGVFTLVVNELTAILTGAQAVASGTVNTIMLQIAHFFGGQQPIVILIILAVLLQIVRSVLDFGGQSAGVFLRVWLEGDLQRRAFAQLMNIRYQQIIESRIGNLASYNHQIAEVGVLLHAFSQLLNDLTLIIAYLVLLFWISWQFTLISVVVLALISLPLNRLRNSIRNASQSFMRSGIRASERIVEYLQGVRIIHIFVREQSVVNEVNAVINAGIFYRRDAFLRRALITPIAQSVAVISMTIFLGIGYWAVSTAQLMTIPQLVTYLFIIYRILPRISSFNGQLGIAAGQWPFIGRVAELLNPADKVPEYTPGMPIEELHTGIEFRNVDMRYPQGERDALSNVSFQVPAGKMVGLVGPSGSGKSSIINLMLGLYNPTGGQILIDGSPLHTYDLAMWRRLIGVVDQDTLIFSNSVAENIRFGKPDAGDEEVAAAAKIANADLFIRELPQGYQTEVGDRGHRLSGGQRQRIAIARAVIHNPALLLFDEATSALDTLSERLIQESLEELRKQRTVVVIAHRLSTIVKADQIILIDSGQILERGTHQELLSLNGRYAAMWRLQANPT
jgi:ATP-binding cassette, subfamily B, bacterial MsbA